MRGPCWLGMPKGAWAVVGRRGDVTFSLTLERGPGFILSIKDMKDGLTIGRLAERSRVSRDTLRFYERRRLLPAPRRTASGYRLYTEEDASRVRFIQRAQAMGLTLEDIRDLLRAQTLKTPDQCRRVASRLRARIEAVDAKVAELRAFRAELARSLEQCERAGAEPGCCPVVLDLTANGKSGNKR